MSGSGHQEHLHGVFRQEENISQPFFDTELFLRMKKQYLCQEVPFGKDMTKLSVAIMVGDAVCMSIYYDL